MRPISGLFHLSRPPPAAPKTQISRPADWGERDSGRSVSETFFSDSDVGAEPTTIAKGDFCTNSRRHGTPRKLSKAPLIVPQSIFICFAKAKAAAAFSRLKSAKSQSPKTRLLSFEARS